MKAFWVGRADSVGAAATTYYFCSGDGLWSTTEAMRSNALSEDVVITKLTAWVTNAPGGATSRSFTIRDDAADTAATVTIAGADTTASWSGEAAISAASLVAMLAMESGSPAASGSAFWTIEYETAGNFYLMLGGNFGSTDNTVTTHLMPCGVANYVPDATAGVHEGIAPSAFTVTKIAANVRTTPGAGKSRTFTALLNRGTDSSFSAVISGANTVAVSSVGTLAFTANARLQVKHVPVGTPAPSVVATCLTITPSVAGEVAWFMANRIVLSQGATGYNSFGPLDFPTVEANAAQRFPACTLKKLIAALGVAPGTGRSRTFTMRSNLADTAVVVPIVDGFVADIDTVHTAPHADGNFLSVKHVPAGTPAANSNTGYGFVTLIDQGIIADTTKFFGFF